MSKAQQWLQEMRNAPDRDLASALDDARKELFNLRFRNATRQLDNTSELKRVRRQIAQLKTLQRERELSAAVEG